MPIQDVVKAIPFNKKGEVLLLCRTKPAPHIGRIDLPGGKRDPLTITDPKTGNQITDFVGSKQEKNKKTLGRELEEETGLTNFKKLARKPISVVKRAQPDRIVRVRKYLCEVKNEDQIQLHAEEHTDSALIDPQAFLQVGELLKQNQEIPEDLQQVLPDWIISDMQMIAQSPARNAHNQDQTVKEDLDDILEPIQKAMERRNEIIQKRQSHPWKRSLTRGKPHHPNRVGKNLLSSRNRTRAR